MSLREALARRKTFILKEPLIKKLGEGVHGEVGTVIKAANKSYLVSELREAIFHHREDVKIHVDAVRRRLLDMIMDALAVRDEATARELEDMLKSLEEADEALRKANRILRDLHAEVDAW